jgi:hypothetical protein
LASLHLPAKEAAPDLLDIVCIFASLANIFYSSRMKFRIYRLVPSVQAPVKSDALWNVYE